MLMAMSDEDICILFSVSDPAEAVSLMRWLEGSGPARVARTPSVPRSGELGVSDVITAAGSASAVVAAVRAIPAFIRARRSDIHVEATIDGERYVIDVKNADGKTAELIKDLLRD